MCNILTKKLGAGAYFVSNTNLNVKQLSISFISAFIMNQNVRSWIYSY